MAKSQDSYNKKEKEKKRLKKKKEKLERREQRKIEKAEKGDQTLEEMFSYVDENGNLTSTPPDPAKKIKVNAADIVIGASPRDDDGPEDINRSGQVKFFNDEKGYGFIIDAVTKDSVFVHINNVNDTIQENDKVTFQVEMGPKGPNAINVNLVE
jgi:cold shock CspA family protein